MYTPEINPTIQFILDWRYFRPGHTTDAIAGGVADLLIKQGYAVAVSPKPSKPKRK